MFRGEFLSLSLFCYNEPIDNGPAARAGYAAPGNNRTVGMSSWALDPSRVVTSPA